MGGEAATDKPSDKLGPGKLGSLKTLEVHSLPPHEEPAGRKRTTCIDVLGKK